MVYHLKFNLTVEEYQDFAAYSSWHAPWQKTNRLKFWVRTFFYSAITMAATLIILSKINPPKYNHNEILIIISIIMLAIVTAFSFYRAPYRVREKAAKLIAKDENFKLLAEREMELSETELNIDNLESRSSLKWSSIVRYSVTTKYFFLYINSEQGYIIPKRLFKNQGEIDEFDNFLTQKIPLSSSFRSLGI